MADEKTAIALPQTAIQTPKLAPPSPRNGNRLPLGNHPGNTGGKKGRSGSKPAIWKETCAQALHEADGIGVVKQLVKGEVPETKPSDRLGAVKFLAEQAYGQQARLIGAQGEIEDGDRRIRFSLIIGERADD